MTLTFFRDNEIENEQGESEDDFELEEGTSYADMGDSEGQNQYDERFEDDPVEMLGNPIYWSSCT